jgi:CID domain
MASPNERNADDATFERKFTNAKNTQESIQSIATWAMHHKNQHSKLVQMWLEVLKKCKYAWFTFLH